MSEKSASAYSFQRDQCIELTQYQSLAINDEKIIDSEEIEVVSHDSTPLDQILVSRKRTIWSWVLYFLIIIALFAISLYFYFTTKKSPLLGGSITKSIPYKFIMHPDPPTGLWGVVAKPYPTGAFWTNLVVKGGDGAIGLYPYGIKTLDSGIQISYGASRRVVTRLSIADIFLCDLQIASTQAYMSRSVEGYDNISVTMGYRTALNGRYRAHLVKSSPFVTTVFDNATPVISSQFSKIASVDAKVRPYTYITYFCHYPSFIFFP